MPKLREDALHDMPVGVQYIYYVLTAFKVVTFKGWIRKGKPNPFVGR